MLIHTGKFMRWAGVVLIGLLFSGAVWAAGLDETVENCDACHGKDGASTDPDIPIIGGLSSQYIIYNMEDYRDRKRSCPAMEVKSGADKGKTMDMCSIANKLSEADFDQLAEHYADKPFVRAKQTADAKLAAAGKELHDRHCEKCHTEGGTLPDDDNGILAGQWMPYLKTAMEAYISGKRLTPDKMKPKIEALKPADVDALVNYYGSFK